MDTKAKARALFWLTLVSALLGVVIDFISKY